jgi:predicted Holliday junction resolvase-like endonuclease
MRRIQIILLAFFVCTVFVSNAFAETKKAPEPFAQEAMPVEDQLKKDRLSEEGKRAEEARKGKEDLAKKTAWKMEKKVERDAKRGKDTRRTERKAAYAKKNAR